MSEINPSVDGKYVVFYDLPSEHRSIFAHNDEATKAVQNCRWKCSALLHELGLECTQSTILVAPSKNPIININIQRVKYMYSNLQTFLWNHGAENAIMLPHLEVLELQGDRQLQQMTGLVEHTLNQKVDRAIERLNELIETIPDLSRQQARRLHYRLPDEVAEWQTVKQMAEAYGINTNNVSYVIDLIEAARAKV